MSSPPYHHDHQTPFMSLTNSSAAAPLTAGQRSHAKKRFESIIEYLSDSSINSGERWKGDLLIRNTYEYSRSELSKDVFLCYFFGYIKQDIHSNEIVKFDKDLLDTLNNFADFLLDNFYLPLKSAGAKTPQPTPEHLSSQSKQGPQELIDTPERISRLRGQCLARDHYRCVISRAFDYQEASEQLFKDLKALDDEGSQLKGQGFDILEVAHIIPHSLAQVSMNSNLPEYKKNARAILNMLDYDVGHLINGTDIDRPHNAMSLTRKFHVAFGNFDIYMEPVAGKEHTYQIKSLNPVRTMVLGLPLTRKLFLSEDQSTEPPSPRLLALHRAIVHVLHVSGAGEYIDGILQDFEEMGVREDGTTELGRMVNRRLGGG